MVKYLAGTRNFGILYQGTSGDILQGLSDSNWGTNPIDRKSTTGVIFTLGSGAVTWLSKKQNIVASSSSTKAEYIAFYAACCQGIWFKRILADCGMEDVKAIQIYCGNKSCIEIAKNPVHHGRTKHIDVKYHFIRDLVSKGLVKLEFFATNEQMADVMTKGLYGQKFLKFLKF